jgi:hypothetical protein
MKKTITLFLLVLFLLNIMGYYGLLVGLRSQAGQKWRESVDRETTGGELLIKVPLAIPYAVDANEYSAVDGEFEHQGEVFRLVKQKLTHDTLYIVCEKDVTSKEINRALADYVKTFSDKPFSAKQSAKNIQPFSKDFYSVATTIQSLHSGFQITIQKLNPLFDFYSFNYQPSISQPPEQIG